MTVKSFTGEPINVGGAQVFINPGAGPVDGATEAEARKNMKQLVIDAGLPSARIRRKRQIDDRGRFGFTVRYGYRLWDIEMPGLSLDRVRYQDGMDPWQFPRMYVNGSSWLWKFAIDILHDEALGD